MNWKKCVINIEAAVDGTNPYDVENRGPPSTWQTRNIRSSGTALFFTHEKRRYLATARHVLYDKLSAQRMLELLQKGQPRRHFAIDESTIFGIIFRRRSLSEVISGSKDLPKFLMNLGAGVSDHAPYTFSEPETDLAVIDLEMRNKDFADELESLGYVPLPASQIKPNPSLIEGQEIAAVGFPVPADIGMLNLNRAEVNWSSSVVSLPIYSFGRVAMRHEALNFFVGDLSIYPGNSGGPVISGEEVVGFVSGQWAIPTESSTEPQVRIPFARIINSSMLWPLLDVQKAKASRWEQVAGERGARRPR